MAAWNLWVCAACQPQNSKQQIRPLSAPAARHKVLTSAEAGSAPKQPCQASTFGLQVSVERLVGNARGTDPWGRVLDLRLFAAFEIRGKPETKFQTDVTRANGYAEWNFSAVMEAYSPGDSLRFAVCDATPEGEPHVIAEAVLHDSKIWPDGFDGELEMGDNLKLRLKVAVPKRLVEEAREERVEALPPRPRASFLRRSSIASDEQEQEGAISVEQEIANAMEMGKYDVAMLLACYSGDATAVEACYRKGAVPLSTDQTGRSNGYFAVVVNSLAVLLKLLSLDAHCEYTAWYFDSGICPDGVTLFMLALWYGSHEVYQYLAYELGCEPRLLGEEYDKAGKGDAPLHKWLEYIPEITRTEQIPKIPPVTISAAHLVSQQRADGGGDDLHVAREHRKQARNWIRKYLNEFRNRQGSNASNGSSEKGSKNGRARSAAARNANGSSKESPSHPGKRNALAGSAGSKERAAEAVKAVPAFGTLLRGLPGRPPAGAGSKKDAAPAMWICGSCRAMAEVGDGAEGKIQPCPACGTKNLLTSTAPVAEPAGDDPDEEIWANTGADSISAKEEKALLPALRKSLLWSLGSHRARELLSAVKVVTKAKKDVLFSEGSRLDEVWLLVEGEVLLTADGRKLASYAPTAKHVELLDARSFCKYSPKRELENAKHDFTATVTSEKAVLYYWRERDITEFTGWPNAVDIVKSATVSMFFEKIRAFGLMQPIAQKDALQGYVHCKVFPCDTVLATKGRGHGKITIIQRGQLLVGNTSAGGKSTGKLVDVGLAGCETLLAKEASSIRKDLAPPSSAPYYILGLRYALFGVPPTVGVSVSTEAIGWEVDARACAAKFEKQTCKLGLTQIMRVAVFMECLHASALFSAIPLSDPRLRALAELVEVQEPSDGCELCKERERAAGMLVLVDGVVAVTTAKEKEERKVVADVEVKKVHHFGESTLLGREMRTETLRVTSSFATVLHVTPDTLGRVFGGVDGLLKELGLSTSQMLERISAGKDGAKTKAGKAAKEAEPAGKTDKAASAGKRGIRASITNAVFGPAGKEAGNGNAKTGSKVRNRISQLMGGGGAPGDREVAKAATNGANNGTKKKGIRASITGMLGGGGPKPLKNGGP